MTSKMLVSAVIATLGTMGSVSAQTVHGADCNLCKDIARGDAAIAPSADAEDILAAYISNQSAVVNCLDLRLLGDPRKFEAKGRWLTDVQVALDASFWLRSSPNGLPPECSDIACLDNTAKLTALFRVVFGQNGLQADMLSSDEKAKLTCKAVFTDLDGAYNAVKAAAQ